MSLDEEIGFRLIGVGDDAVVALTKPLEPGVLVKGMEMLGFSTKEKVTDDWQLVDFCSGYFWQTDEGIVWGPKPGRLLAKIGVAVTPPSKPEEWFKGVLLGIKQDVNHVPVAKQYVDHCLRLLARERGQAIVDEHKFHVSKQHNATGETYLQFYKIYNLSPVDVTDLQQTITGVTSLPYLVYHPALDSMVVADS